MTETVVQSWIYFLGLPIYVVGATASIVEFWLLEQHTKKNIQLLLSDLILIFLEFFVKIYFGIYIFNQDFSTNYSLFQFNISFLSFFFAFALYDLFFYAEHYLMHRSPFFWTIHYVHHSSERFGLSIGFRLSWFRPIRRFIFFMPLVLFGFHPAVVILAMSIINLWAFLVHTGIKFQFPRYLWFLMSPHLHSIHHEKKTVSVNLGGLSTVWDYAFKTIQTTAAAHPEYGVENYKVTMNPFKNQFLYFYTQYIKKPQS